MDQPLEQLMRINCWSNLRGSSAGATMVQVGATLDSKSDQSKIQAWISSWSNLCGSTAGATCVDQLLEQFVGINFASKLDSSGSI